MLWAATLTDAGRHLVWDSISKKAHARSLQDPDTPVMQLVRSKRDLVMCDRLRRFVEDPARIAAGQPVAVIAGAAHMPALYATLRDCGFQKGSVRWFEVLDGLTIPSRGTPGRAVPFRERQLEQPHHLFRVLRASDSSALRMARA